MLHLALQRLGIAARRLVNLAESETFADGVLRGPRGGRPPEHYYTEITHKVKTSRFAFCVIACLSVTCTVLKPPRRFLST